MPEQTFEIRICKSCGLRYPLSTGHTHGTRCPICIGETRVALRRNLEVERNRLPVDLTLSPSPKRRGRATILLDNIRSAGNVGSILRSAEGFGFMHAYLCGITPTPENDAVQKTSLGAEDSVPWSYHKNAVKLVKGLKVDGWKIYGLEETAKASAISKLKKSKEDMTLIVGNEITGVDPGLLSLCDEIFFIPMRGEKKSFNAAVAFGIAAYALTTTGRTK
ncbi:MAG: 23S rRNA (guanosine-2'-O-)-methyltransferase RlmB [Anaerolineales bacterium]|nr:23S rRNA (guanosine-2'-O-)-methyltransferase RlmB [Anaerolineales bacterium]WKZ48715.1 MAG: TrmH family RNA methyltransferase [Anaerolineales bacterium]